MAGASQEPAEGGSQSTPAVYAQQFQNVGIHSDDLSQNNNHNNSHIFNRPNNANASSQPRPLILITDNSNPNSSSRVGERDDDAEQRVFHKQQQQVNATSVASKQHEQKPNSVESEMNNDDGEKEDEEEEEQVEIVDGIKYRIVAAVTKPPTGSSKFKRRGLNSANTANQYNQINQNQNNNNSNQIILEHENETSEIDSGGLMSSSGRGNKLGQQQQHQQDSSTVKKRLNSVRRKSSAFVTNLLQNSFLGPQSASNYEIGGNGQHIPRPRRLSIYEMTKSPPPETSLEIYLSERRRSSTISSKQVQQQLEQQTTFETNYCQRQQYFKDLNQKLINHDKKLLNVVANRGQIHRHSVDIAQLPLHLAQAKASKANKLANASKSSTEPAPDEEEEEEEVEEEEEKEEVDGGQHKRTVVRGPSGTLNRLKSRLAGDHHHHPGPPTTMVAASAAMPNAKSKRLMPDAINQSLNSEQRGNSGLPDEQQSGELGQQLDTSNRRLTRLSIHKDRSILDKRGSVASSSRRHSGGKKSRIVIRKFQKLDLSQLSSTPAPEVKIGQRVAYKEYYGNEFGTIRWIGRVPQICPDWTAGVEFDNAIGEGDGSLNGRRYFIAKDCFAKFLPLNEVAFVDQHVGRPEPGTMISVMSAAVRPGQMISIQRVSTVHVQHCFLNAPHQIPGADILAVNTRLHCQCPNCGPCAHVIKPPRTQRLARSKKNATHMCQFSTYTCCGMESQEEAMCTYTGNRATSSLPPPTFSSSNANWPPIGNSWIEGSGYLTNLQAQQSKMMPDEYKMGAAPEDVDLSDSRRHKSSRRGSGRHHQNHRHKTNNHTIAKDDEQPGISGAQPPEFNQATPSYTETSPPPVGNWQPSEQVQAGSGYLSDSKMTPASCEQAATDTSQRFFSADENMQDPPSYSPNPDYANFNNNNQQQTLASFPKKTTAYVEPVWCESNSSTNNNNNNSNNTPKLGPKSAAAKVVYRDSIENRYLFPTDDPIDSTLEADLENLSQARYGHHSTNLRLNGSKNIFKSLRSLVSCLSAQSNHSEIMERRSENTIKFSEFGDRGGTTTSKAMPVLSPFKQPIDDFLVQSNQNSSREEKENLYQQKQQANINSNNNNISNLYARANQHSKIAYNVASNDNQQQQQQQTVMRQISSSSDCGFSSASQNSINFQSYQANSPQISAEERRKRNQIYNNFLAHLMNSTTMNEDDLNRLRRVLFEPHFDNCCPIGSINQVSLGDTFGGEAEQILAEGIKKSCMFHEKGYEQMHQRPSSACYHHATNYYHPTNNSTNAMMSGDRTRKNHHADDYCLNSHHESVHSSQVNKIPKRKSLIDGSSSTTSESATLSSYDSFNGTAVICDDNQSSTSSKGVDGKNCSKSRMESDRLSNGNSTSLPKAFELKLTLSINNAEKIMDQNSASIKDSATVEPDIENLDETAGNLLNSTFNINIISQKRKEDRTTEPKAVNQNDDDDQTKDPDSNHISSTDTI